MKILLIIIVLLPLTLSSAIVSGQVIDADTQTGVSNILVFIQRTYPNPWDNVYFVDMTDANGSFSITNATMGTYRVYSGFSNDYFAGYYQNYIHLADDSEITNIIFEVEAIQSSMGIIEGSLNLNQIPEDTTFFNANLYQYVNPEEYEISYGFVELDANSQFSFSNLNTGLYKLKLTYYGQFNGEMWYGGYDSIEESPYLEITPDNPVLNVNFDFTHPYLNEGYIIVDDVIVNSGIDDVIGYGETITFSLLLKNIGSDLTNDAVISINNYFPQISFNNVQETVSNVLSNQTIEIGPYVLTVSNDIDNEFAFGLNYTYVNNSASNQSSIEFTAYAPVIEISNVNIVSNGGVINSEGINSVVLQIENSGGVDLVYPEIRIYSDDESVQLDSDFMNGYFLISPGINQIDYMFDFSLSDNVANIDSLDFRLEISNLNEDFEQSIGLTLLNSSATNNAEEQNISTKNEVIGNYPNPFNPTTTIYFTTDNPSNTVLSVYNLLGQNVKSFDTNSFVSDNNQYSVVWNGENDSGDVVPSGIYFYKLRSGSYIKTKKMVLLK